MNDLSNRTAFDDGNVRITVSDSDDNSIWITQHSIPDSYSRSIKVPAQALDPLAADLELRILERALTRKERGLEVTIDLDPGEAFYMAGYLLLQAVDGFLFNLYQSLKAFGRRQ